MNKNQRQSTLEKLFTTKQDDNEKGEKKEVNAKNKEQKDVGKKIFRKSHDKKSEKTNSESNIVTPSPQATPTKEEKKIAKTNNNNFDIEELKNTLHRQREKLEHETTENPTICDISNDNTASYDNTYSLSSSTESLLDELQFIHNEIKNDDSKDKINQLKEVIKEKTKEEIAEEKSMERRLNIIKEMFETETTYMDFMKEIIMLFITPLDKVIKDRVVYTEYYSVLFQNITSIQDLHWELYKTMSKRYFKYTKSEVWCDIFIETFSQADFLDRYQRYINGYDQAAALVTNAKKAANSKGSSQLATLGEFIDKQLTNSKYGFASLTSFLIAPVQRLPRYLLFFRDLLKCTSPSHVDYFHISEASDTLNKIVQQINKQKGIYDQIYRIEELYLMFSENDRAEIKLITDPLRSLIAEGPIIEGTKNPKLKYIILMTDVLICSSKDEDDGDILIFEWKVDLCTSGIEFTRYSDDEGEFDCIQISSQKKITNYPYTLKHDYILRVKEDERVQTFAFWKEKFDISEKAKKNLQLLIENQSFADMQGQLLSEVGDEDLFYDWDLVLYKKNDAIREQGTKKNAIMLLKEGYCQVQIQYGDSIKVVGEIDAGQFIGEISYLSDTHTNDVSTASVVVKSDWALVFTKTYRELNESLRVNSILASKFFQLLSLILANRFIKQKLSGTKGQRNVSPIEINNINVINGTIKKAGATNTATTRYYIDSDLISAKTSKAVKKQRRKTLDRSSISAYFKGKFNQNDCDDNNSEVNIVEVKEENCAPPEKEIKKNKSKTRSKSSETNDEEMDSNNSKKVEFDSEKEDTANDEQDMPSTSNEKVSKLHTMRSQFPKDFSRTIRTYRTSIVHQSSNLTNNIDEETTSLPQINTPNTFAYLPKKSATPNRRVDDIRASPSTPGTLNTPISPSSPSIKQPEAIIHHFFCTMKKSPQSTYGELTISRNAVTFHSKVFAFHQKKLIQTSEIDKVEEISSTPFLLRIYYYKGSKSSVKTIDFVMKNSSELHRSIQTIASFSQRNRSDLSNHSITHSFNLASHLPNNSNNQKSNHNKNVEELISDNDDFFKLKSKDWALILSSARKRRVKENKIILEQGVMPAGLYQIVKGSCRVEVLHPDGSTQVVGKLEEGEMFGEISFLLGLVSSASVIANSVCLLLEINKSNLELLLFNEARISAAFYRVIAKTLRDRLVRTQKRIDQGSSKSF